MSEVIHDTYWVPCHVEAVDEGTFLHTFDGHHIIKIKGEPERKLRNSGLRSVYTRFKDGNFEMDLMEVWDCE